MTQPNSYLIVPGLLLPAELETIEKLLQSANFEDGATTATAAAKAVKHNLQLPKEGSMVKSQIDMIVLQAMTQSPLVQAAVMPTRILPPIISKYEVGMQYGYHVDSPIVANPQAGVIRADMAMTLFLSDPNTYEGGELSLYSPTGEVRYKLTKGDAIIYPCTQVHGVLPVTAGVRVAAVTWLQCAVRDQMQRELLFQLKSAQALVEQKNNQAPENLVLLQVYSNLLRMWAEV